MAGLSIFGCKELILLCFLLHPRKPSSFMQLRTLSIATGVVPLISRWLCAYAGCSCQFGNALASIPGTSFSAFL
jgi:hypothetical protein